MEGYSPEFQERGGFEYADRIKVRINRDRLFNFVESAYKEKKRKKFFEFLDYARNGPEQHVLIPKVDRALRNFAALAKIDEFRESTDKILHFFDDGLVLSKDSPASDILRLGIQGTVASWYSKDLEQKVKKGLKEKAMHGGWSGKAGFGYKNVGDGKKIPKHIEPNPETAPWFIRIKELAATGYMSIDAILERLRGEGCPHKLTRNQIERTIRNPLGAGRFMWGGEWYEGKHTPLITWELHEAAIRGLERKNKPKYRERSWPYAGLLKCGLCGRSIVFEEKQKKLRDGRINSHVYAHCTGVRYGTDAGCKNPYLTNADLDRALVEIVRAVDIDKQVVDYILSELSSGADKEALERMTRLAVARRELAKLKTFIEQAYRDKMEGKIAEDFWLQQTRQWQEEQIRRQEEIKRLDDGGPSNYIAAARQVLEPLISLMDKYNSMDAFKRGAVLRTLCSNGLQRGKSIEPVYRKPFDILARGRASGNWLRD